MAQAAPGRRQRIHCAEFKAQAVQAVQASQQPGVSMAVAAMAHGINTHLPRHWILARAQASAGADGARAHPVGFISVPMPAPSVPPKPGGEPLRIEVRRGSTTVAVTWATPTCAGWHAGEAPAR